LIDPASFAPELGAMRADVAALAAMTRDSAGPGERASAPLVRDRLAQSGAVGARVEPYRYQRSYALAHAAHAAAGLAGARRGGLAGAATCLGALASLELEASGRRQWIRRLLPSSEGANALARVPAAGAPRATLVLVAHHDAAHTGVVWHPRLVALGARRRLRRRRVDPFMGPLAAALAAGAVPRLRGAAGAVLATSLLAYADIARGATVPGASDNATGVAALIALTGALARDPLPHTEVVALAPGSEEAGMGGMAAFLAAHRAELRARPALVLGVDTLGAGTPVVCSGEGPLREHRYREADLRLADEGAALARLAVPERWRLGGWTDPVLALFAGLPAISLLSMGPGYFPNYHWPTDTPERVDWDSVERCTRLALGVATAFARRTAG
jgi:peptidase M28-like protein